MALVATEEKRAEYFHRVCGYERMFESIRAAVGVYARDLLL